MTLTRYQQLRPQIQTGDLLGFQGEGLLSKAIMLRSRFSHVALLLRVLIGSQERILLAHAVYPRGVVFDWASEYLRTYKGTGYWVALKHGVLAEKTPGYPTRLIDFMASHSGADHEPRRPYDVRGVLSYVLPFLKHRKAAHYCSELVAEAFRELGWLTRSRYDPEELISQWVCDLPVELS